MNIFYVNLIATNLLMMPSLSCAQTASSPHVPVYLPHRTLQGVRWAFNGSYKFFTDNFLCFGLKNSPSIFHRISCALTRIMARKGFSNIVNYLDDFLIVASSREECVCAQPRLIHLLHSLGFQVNCSTLSGHSKRVKFLGIILDSIAMQAFVPEDKISALEDQLTFLISHRKASKRDLQRVAGLMNFLAKVVKGGRTFLRRVLDFIIRLKRPFYKARITSDPRKDFCWWLNCCHVFNGKAINIYYSPIVEHAYNDASLSGFGTLIGLLASGPPTTWCSRVFACPEIGFTQLVITKFRSPSKRT